MDARVALRAAQRLPRPPQGRFHPPPQVCALFFSDLLSHASSTLMQPRRLFSSGERVTLGGFLRRKAVGPLRTVFQNQFLKLDETAARADTVLCDPKQLASHCPSSS
eukprot:2072413-Rhodomonas_salina.1